jgi:hypothetical protein
MKIYVIGSYSALKKFVRGFTVCGILALMLDFFFSEDEDSSSSS